MADVIIKKWNGTGWEEHYPKTTVGNIVATGNPSSTTFLRGDGTWSFVPIVTKSDLTWTYVYGKAEVNITKGQALQFAGVQGDHILLKPAVPSEINANPDYFVGLAEANALANDFIYVVDKGEIRDVNTVAYPSGTILWYQSEGSTAGLLRSTEPSGNVAKIQVGAVTKSNETEGIILVRVNFFGVDIEDIKATGTPSSTTFLRGDGTWATPASASGDFLPLTGGTLTGGLNVQPSAGGNSHIALDVGSSTFNNYLTTTANGTTFFRSFTPSPDTYTTRMVIKGGGNVGIGTESPVSSSRLTITQMDANGSQIRMSNTASGGNDWVMGVGSSSSTSSIVSPGSLFFYDTDSSLTRMILDTNGNVGIGTTSPSAKLQVEGDLLINNPSVYGRINGHDTYHSIVLRGNISGTSSQSVVPNDSMTFAEYGGIFRFKQLTPSANTDLITLTPSGLYIGGSTNNGRIYADDWGIKVGTDSGHVWIGPANSGHAHIYTDRPNFYFNKDLLVNGSTVIHSGTIGSQSVSYATTSSQLHMGGSSTKLIADGVWAGASGYPGYQFTGGNSRFGFSSTSGYIDVYTDGNFYAGIDLNGSNNLVLHAGNYSSYAMPIATSFVSNLDALTSNGIYRQEAPTSGFNYTTTLNLTSSDGRQQLTIARGGDGIKFRGNNSGSGTAGWSSWKTIWHDSNDGSGSGLDADLLDGRDSTVYMYYRGVNINSDFQSFQSTSGIVRFDQVNDSNALANKPPGYTYGGVASFRGDNFGLQIWGSHTGDLYYKTQWNNDQYSGWRTIIHSGNIGSQSVSYSNNSGALNGYVWNSAGKDVRGSEIYVDGWFRNYNANTGLYNQTTTQHWYSTGNGTWRSESTTFESQIQFATSGNALRGSVNADSSNNIGFRNQSNSNIFRLNSLGDVIAGGSRFIAAVAVGVNTDAVITLPAGVKNLEIQMLQDGTTQSNTIQRFFLTTASIYSLSSSTRNARVTWFNGTISQTMTVSYYLSSTTFRIRHNFNFTVGYRVYAHF